MKSTAQVSQQDEDASPAAKPDASGTALNCGGRIRVAEGMLYGVTATIIAVERSGNVIVRPDDLGSGVLLRLSPQLVRPLSD